MLYMELMRGALSSVFCKELEDSKEFFLNGSKLLEALITQLNGQCKIQIRNFSAKEIVKATNNFDSHNLVWPLDDLNKDSHNRVWPLDDLNKDSVRPPWSGIYKGSFQQRQILVKRHDIFPNLIKKVAYYWDSLIWEREGGVDSIAVRDIVISSQMSFHKNTLTLIGYCLDFEYPLLVYQSPEANDDNCLFYTKEMKLTWKNRMSIAYDIANVLAYLHTGFSTPLIHRDIDLRNFVIDKHGTAKLADFSSCIAIPLGKCQVEDDVVGTPGYIDPIYIDTGVLTEKADVYNVGVVLVELFTGKEPQDYNGDICYSWDNWRSYIERDDVENIVSDNIVIEEGTLQIEQLRAFAVLTLKCLEPERENRPQMVDVAKELRRIQRLGCSSSCS